VNAGRKVHRYRNICDTAAKNKFERQNHKRNATAILQAIPLLEILLVGNAASEIREENTPEPLSTRGI
jgi:hypothetical protein